MKKEKLMEDLREKYPTFPEPVLKQIRNKGSGADIVIGCGSETIFLPHTIKGYVPY